MESNNINQISIDIPNYSGPLDILLDLAKSQKVDLAEISITKLADQFLEYIKNSNELMSMIFQIKEAGNKDGGSGAFYVYLKKKL